MDPAAIAARLALAADSGAAASTAVAPIVEELFVREGPGAGPVDRPVRISGLVSFQGDARTLTERDLTGLAARLVREVLGAVAPGEAKPAGDEGRAVVDALARTLHALGTVDLNDVQAVRLGPERFARHLAVAAPDAGRDLSAGAARLHGALLELACLHMLRFFTRRSAFVARALADSGGRQSESAADTTSTTTSTTSATSADDAAFEERYAHDIVTGHDHLTIYGIDLAHSPDSWPLDSAYLSLEAETDAGPSAPADQALSGRERVLLRGVAGSGKTTLVQWLAVSVARGELPQELEGLRGRVPFVLQVRRFGRDGFPGPADFLASVRHPRAGGQPAGWAERVLSAGRGLLLVDGVDEVPEEDRERLRHALRRSLARYPGNVWLVTSRPSAVRENWLASEGFTELRLAPLSREGVAAFIQRWHAAAREDAAADLDRLDAYEQTLLDAVRINRELGRLATNPLMCGLICALHRDRRGYLPRGRKALYDAALSMLLERRDRERSMPPPDGIDLTQEPKIQLLQKLARWMLVNGRAEMDRPTAVSTLAQHLPAIPHAAQQGGPEEIYRHLLNRTGLLREPAPGAVDFVHRTFQDYLSARAVVERHDFDFLIEHAHQDDWEEVIRMSVALARPDECAYILDGLIAARKGSRPVQARHRKLLAAACLEHATELDPEVRARVHRYTRDLVRPTTLEGARALGWIGPIVLEMLPDPTVASDEEAHRLAVTATSIADDRAIDYLVRLRDRTSWAVRSELASAWRRYDTDRYADEIIAHLDERELDFPVSNLEELHALRRLGGRPCVQIAGAFTPRRLVEGLVADRLTELWLAYDLGTHLDLQWLAAFPRLHTLRLSSRNAGVTGVPEGVQVIVTGP
ncbi:NACHT domain-containing protein [Streptomyces sp. ME19-01-6]|uniref:NACHT domain-containing protein n=1 Tax=Streptomyces sp. ME19-01-6 TaxID=3028686 RepID=UPI0029B27268|nr:NACHT domain-containing protein [Streptomyces sp. ME19-01-6]MDX3228233.1 NACHT domain-containing protein [Streptomyces sp. ME19-01-6]